MQNKQKQSGRWSLALKSAPLIILIFFVFSCQTTTEKNLWFIECFEGEFDACGYKDASGKIMIDYGKYPMCFTDTFKTYAIVLKPEVGFVGINKEEEILYNVLPYDNGPDYPSEGYFRIIKDNKIGFADVATGIVKIEPAFAAAFPFTNRYAAVCPDCILQQDGEYSRWVGGKWGIIDKKGKIVLEPGYDEIIEISADHKVKVRTDIYEQWIDLK